MSRDEAGHERSSRMPPWNRVRLYSDDVGEHRIVVDHRIMGGVPCVAGTRVPVATVVGLVATGLTPDEIRADYPQLTVDDIRACLAYAARAVDERELPVRFTA
jgi:uncharacterized protein (DUF433 family)